MRAMKFVSPAMILLITLLFTWVFAAAQAPADQTTLKHVPITHTPAYSGKEMFKSYCAVCHGTDGKGNGPAASALKSAPVDLTTLAQKNGGKYPSIHVAAVIRGQATLVAHGTQDMPVWGPLFSSVSQGRESETQQRIANLTDYISTLQAK
ncbi:MAG TPA: c-type cytochrome [Candidatus Solibacter sp.]|nr:c-type cytochrome [Candidatus Solibacter sp.]